MLRVRLYAWLRESGFGKGRVVGSKDVAERYFEVGKFSFELGDLGFEHFFPLFPFNSFLFELFDLGFFLPTFLLKDFLEVLALLFIAGLLYRYLSNSASFCSNLALS